jgi:hypothetical protein
MSMCEARHAAGDRPLRIVVLLLILALGGPACLGAEEILVKADAKYLGWSIPDGKFKTCWQTVLPIGGGKLEKTKDKCQFGPGPGPFTATGTIKFIDAKASLVTIEKANGQPYKAVVSEEALESSGLSMGSLKTGDKVTIKGPVDGHASSVQRTD